MSIARSPKRHKGSAIDKALERAVTTGSSGSGIICNLALLGLTLVGGIVVGEIIYRLV